MLQPCSYFARFSYIRVQQVVLYFKLHVCISTIVLSLDWTALSSFYGQAYLVLPESIPMSLAMALPNTPNATSATLFHLMPLKPGLFRTGNGSCGDLLDIHHKHNLVLFLFLHRGSCTRTDWNLKPYSFLCLWSDLQEGSLFPIGQNWLRCNFISQRSKTDYWRTDWNSCSNWELNLNIY